MKIKALAALIVTVALNAVPAPMVAAAADTAIALPNCAGKPVVKPSALVLTCADAGVSVSHILWTGWGSRFAAGVGTASVNDCTPYCAAGHFHNFRVVLIAAGRGHCPDGRNVYSKVTYAWIGRSPFPQAAANPDPVVPFPCAR